MNQSTELAGLIELNPCRKCTSSNVTSDQFNSVTRNRWVISCDDCDYMTETHETEAEAVASWNRPTLTEAPEPLVERVWSALKDRVCADPENAKRCVMVGRDDVAAALSSITTTAPSASEPFDVTASMKVWPGGDEPADYDGGMVLRRNGRVNYPTGPYAWKHDTRWPEQDADDIIAYTPVSSITTTEIPSAAKPGSFGLGGVVEPRWQTEGDTSATTTEVEVARSGCPKCEGEIGYMADPARCFCDNHFREYLMARKICPTDLDRYRGAVIANLDDRCDDPLVSDALEAEERRASK